MLAQLDFTLSSRQALQQTVVFPTVSVTGISLFPAMLKLPHLKLPQCSGLVAEERLGAESAIFYGWIGLGHQNF